jgi:ParB/RepB/Spo0J family partition protein
MHDENIKDLMQTIKDNGLLQPIGVKELDKGYIIIWGNRRLDACKKLGWKSIAAVIFSEKDEEMTEEEFFVINAIENLQQKPTSLFELGRICKVLKRNNMSIGEIAVRLGVTKSRVESALLEISRIPVPWQKRIRIMGDGCEKKGDIPMITASKVARLRGLNDSEKNQLFNYISKNEATTTNVDLIGSLIKSGKSLPEAIKATDKFKPLDIKLFVNKKRLDEALRDYNSSIIDLAIGALNEKYPGLAFKNVREG